MPLKLPTKLVQRPLQHVRHTSPGHQTRFPYCVSFFASACCLCLVVWYSTKAISLERSPVLTDTLKTCVTSTHFYLTLRASSFNLLLRPKHSLRSGTATSRPSIMHRQSSLLLFLQDSLIRCRRSPALVSTNSTISLNFYYMQKICTWEL